MPVLLILLLSWMCCMEPLAGADPALPPASPTVAPGSSSTTVSPPPAADPLAALNAAQLQELFQRLSRHAVDPAMFSQEALNRAALRSLLADPRTGALVLAIRGNPIPAAALEPLHARLGHNAAYVRAGALSAENIAVLSGFLTGLPSEITTLILDLRAPQAPASLGGAAALVSLFLPEKTPLYLLSNPPAAPSLQISAAPQIWTKRVWLLLDDQSPPPAELAAHLLVKHLHSCTFGTPTSGLLTETSDRPLGPHHLLRLPASTVLWPDGSRLTGTPLRPKIAIAPLPGSRQALFALTDPAELPIFLSQTDRPRHNEAALMAGIPPELVATASANSSAEGSLRPDPVLQQATDLLQNIGFLKLDAPEEIKRAQPGP